MSKKKLSNNQGTARIDDNQGTARIDDDQGTVRIGDSSGTAIISGAGNASGIMSQPKMGMQGLASNQKQTGEVFTTGQLIELNGKNCTIESTISMNSGEAVIYKINIDGRPYVLKHYKLETPLRDEAKDVLKKIKDNPKERIVKVYDFGRHNEQDFEIMEYAEGGTLDQYLKENGPIHDQEKLKDIIKQINEGLEQLHSELNIIYQDLKPENIYFRDANKMLIVLADFGISSLMQDGKEEVDVVANVTDLYAAPELAHRANRKEVTVTPSVDYFALGITMMELWLGEKPFKGIKATKRDYMITEENVDLHDMPDDYATLIKGLIKPQRKERMGNGQIQKWLKGESLTSHGKKTAKVSTAYGPLKFSDKDIASNPKELAALMEKYPDKGITCLYSDIVKSWLQKAEADLLLQQIKDITSIYADDKQAGLYVAIYTLDPDRPFISNGGKTCTTTEEIADALMDESTYYMEELKSPEAKLYLYFEAIEGSQGKEIAEQFQKNFQEYSPKRALNLVWLKFQPDGGKSITIGSKTYQSLEEVSGETDSKQIDLLKKAVVEEDSLFLVWLSDCYGKLFTSTGGYKKLETADKFFLLGKLPFLSYKEFDTDWEENAGSDLCSLINNNPGRSDLFDVYAKQGLPFTVQDNSLDWKPTAINYLSLFFYGIINTNKINIETGLGLIRFLHEHGADVNECSGSGTLPLSSAIYIRNVQVVELLLELGADPNIITNESSMLHWALYTLSDVENDQENEDKRIAIANLFLDYKVNVNISDDTGRTPLSLAAYMESSKKTDLISRLLTAGADANKVADDGSTPLMAAVYQYCNTTEDDKKPAALEVIELLLKKGAKTEVLQKNGYCSPLMRAANVNAIEAAELLLKYGAKKDFADKYSNTAYVYAAHENHAQMKELLDPRQAITERKRLFSTARFLVSTLAILTVFLTMDVLARAILAFHFSFPVLAGASFLLSHLLTSYILIVILGISGYLDNLRGTFNYIGSGLLYILGVPIIFPLMVLPLQFLTRFLPESINAALTFPAEMLTNLPNGIAMLTGFLALLAAIMTGAVFINKVNDKLAMKMAIIANS